MNDIINTDYNEEKNKAAHEKLISLHQSKYADKILLKQRVNSKQIDEMLSKFDEYNKIQQEILEYNGSNSRGSRS